MHDEYRIPERADFHKVVTILTHGLRELPTDYATRVKNFLTEYLGNAQHPVPFGGRSKDFEQLDTWLADPLPYLLLAAPAGRGKSALLLRWCQKLLTQRNLAVAYFPVSIRFRTNLAGVAFPALVALLAGLHGEKVPADPNMHEEVWRSLFLDYITRPLPDGRPLLLVLDGVDEAADWVAGPDLFPLNPPPGLHVVLSARYLANDQDASAWLKRLGWTRQGLARTLELYPLDRTGIASVLMQMGFPLDLLGTRANIISELYRLSEGDPLLVRLYIDDLWERGEAAVRFQPEDLRTIRPGLAGYFERWWKDQRLLWSQEAPQREAAAQTVLNLLAGALGPLNKEDILNLIADEAGFRQADLAQHLASLARFVSGDGIHQGYVFSHPRLGNYFLEEHLSARERQDIERRFLTWGEQTLTALNAGHLAPENASAYIVQYYGAHLERAQADTSTLLTLVSNGWRQAWEKLDRAYAGFLGDVERARQAAEHTDVTAISTGEQLPYQGEEIRCLLSQVSINSVTSNISPTLMLEAVKTGIWTPAQGLACIRLITDLAPRARELVKLAPYVHEPLRTDILQEALDTVATIKDEYARLDVLVELAPGLSEELLWQVLDIIPQIEDEADRAGILAELAPSLAPYQVLIEQTLDFIQMMTDDEYRALALDGLAPYFSANQHQRVLQLVQTIQEERYRAQALTAQIPYLAESFLHDALQEARAIQDGLSRIRLLAELVLYLTDPLRTETMQETLELMHVIEDRDYRVEMFVKLAPCLTEEKLQQALQEIPLLLDESYQALALSDLIQYTPDTLLPELLQVVQTMRSEEKRTMVLIPLLPRLSEDLLEQVLSSIQTTWDEGRRVELLAQLAPYATPSLLPRLLEITSTIEDRGYRVWLLAELEVSLAGTLQEKHFDTLTEIFQTILSKEDQLQTLLAILPRLSEEALAKIFDFMLPGLFGFPWTVQSEGRRAQILTKIGGRLPKKWLATAMRILLALKDEQYQVQVLVALAPHIRGPLLSNALDIVRTMKKREKRAQVLEVLVSSLPDEHKGEKVQQMLQVLQVIKDETERAHFVAACASYLPDTVPSAKAQLIVEAMQTDERNQVRILSAFAPHMPEDLFEQELLVVQKLSNEEARASMLEALAPYVPERYFSSFLHIVQELPTERWRTQVLAFTISHAPKHLIAEMLEIVPKEQNAYQRAEILEALIPHTPESSFSQLWEAVQAIPDEGKRVWVLGALALRMPEGFFPQFWEAIQLIPNEGWRIWVLRALVPHMSESLFSYIWETILPITDEDLRTQIMRTMAQNVPAPFFSQVWEVVRVIPGQMIRWQIMEALAPCVPASSFSPFLLAVQSIPNAAMRMQTLSALISHIPEHNFSQFLTAALELPYDLPVQVLLKLIPYVPEDFFALFWEAIQTLQSNYVQEEILVQLAPHTPKRFLPSLWQAMQDMENRTMQVQVMKTLLPHLTTEELSGMLTIIQSQPDKEETVEIMEALVPVLSVAQCVKVLNILMPQPEEQLATVLTQTDRKWRARSLAVLAPHLPQERLLVIMPALLKTLRTFKTENDQVWWILTRLVSNVPDGLLEEMLEILWTINTEPYRTRILKTFLGSLSQTAWAKVLTLVTAKMHATTETNFMVQMLKAAGPLVQQSSPALLYPVIHEFQQLASQRTRRETLADLALLAPAICVSGGPEAIIEACCATLEVGNWWP